MTKQEVRSVALSKLAPSADAVVYDIGAGTGSCTVELALQAPFGKVYAFEINGDAFISCSRILPILIWPMSPSFPAMPKSG